MVITENGLTLLMQWHPDVVHAQGKMFIWSFSILLVANILKLEQLDHDHYVSLC